MKRFSILIAALGALVFVLAMPAAVYSAPPSNDNFANATAITRLPFTDTVDITEATIEPGEPIADPSQIGRTVWYSFTPTADAVAQIGPVFSPPDPSKPPTDCDLRSYRFLVAYRTDSAGFAGLVGIAGGQWMSARVYTLQVHGGTTYYIQGGQTWALGCGENTFSLSVSVVPQPPNDNFANAIAFTSVPFSDSRDLTGATIEPGEPMACGSNFSQSAWYKFTPTVGGDYGGDPGVRYVNVYTGTALSDLTNVACSQWWGLAFHANAGTTYYLQYYGGGMRVDLLPPVAADFTYTPGDPSTLDDVSFSYWNGGYWNPSVTGYAWDFGDGTTGTGSPASHRFARDGDYTITLTVFAEGGRRNTATKVVQVRTPDTTPPVITVPADITLNATSPAGANVSFTATATDEDPANPAVTCTPPSGSVFAIGDTQVVCSATDTAGLTATKSFSVHVKGAPEQVADLIVLVDSYKLGQLGTALHEKLVNVQTFLAANKPERACNVLDRFLAQVKEQRGKRISIERADRLILDARRIKAVVGC